MLEKCHFVNVKILLHQRTLVGSSNQCLKQLRYYFENESVIVNKFKDHFEDVYQIRDIFNNDIDALQARIEYVQDREPTSSYVYEQNA